MGSVTLFEAFPEFFQSPSVLPPKDEPSVPVWGDDNKIGVLTQPIKREREAPFDGWGKIDNQDTKKLKIDNNPDQLPPPLKPLESVNLARWKMPPPRSSPPRKPPQPQPEEDEVIGVEVQKRLYMAKVASRCSWDGSSCLRDDQCSFVISVLQLTPPRRMKRVEVIQKIEVKSREAILLQPQLKESPSSLFSQPVTPTLVPTSQSDQNLPKGNLKLESEESSMFSSPASRILHLPEENPSESVNIPRLSLSPLTNSVAESVQMEMVEEEGENQWPPARVLHLPEESTNTDSLLETLFGISSSKPTVASPFFTACQPKTSSLVRSTTPSSSPPPSQRAVTPQSSSPSPTSSTAPELSFASQVQGLKASQGISEAGHKVNLNSNQGAGDLNTSQSTNSEALNINPGPGTRPSGSQAPSGRCGHCPGCVAAGTNGPKSTPTRRLASADCGTCRSCMDKKSNGGKGILKKACVAKQCHRLFAKQTASTNSNTLPNSGRTSNIPSNVLAPVPQNIPSTFSGQDALKSSQDLLSLMPLMASPLTLPLKSSSPERENSIQHLAVSLPFPCSTCDFTFSSSNDLAKHMRNKHIDYKCSKCMGSFQGYYRMANHMKREHRGEPTLACPCGRTFSVQKGLAKHQTTCALGA